MTHSTNTSEAGKKLADLSGSEALQAVRIWFHQYAEPAMGWTWEQDRSKRFAEKLLNQPGDGVEREDRPLLLSDIERTIQAINALQFAKSQKSQSYFLIYDKECHERLDNITQRLNVVSGDMRGIAEQIKKNLLAAYTIVKSIEPLTAKEAGADFGDADFKVTVTPHVRQIPVEAAELKPPRFSIFKPHIRNIPVDDMGVSLRLRTTPFTLPKPPVPDSHVQTHDYLSQIKDAWIEAAVRNNNHEEPIPGFSVQEIKQAIHSALEGNASAHLIAEYITKQENAINAAIKAERQRVSAYRR